LSRVHIPPVGSIQNIHSATIKMILLLCFAALPLICVQAMSIQPTVCIGSGSLIGSKMLSTEGRVFLAFRGIPYAQPPVGPLRFKDPKPSKKWTGVLNATEEKPACMQFDARLGKFRGQEDCLTLNVYTHDVMADTKKRPVMVWIHGGSYTTGSGNGENDIYGPNNLIDRDIVLVSINYRLSVMGFLSTEDSVAPGNYGLLDQRCALRWVKENIAKFGGDPSSVTIFGQSSGAASVHGHILSPRSKGLFQRAIAQSGSMLCPWALLNYVGNYTKKLAAHMNCPTDNSSQLVQCLQSKDAMQLIQFQLESQVLAGSPVGFGPRIDVERKKPFFPQHPADIIRSGSFNHVPFITGVNSNEAGFIVARMLSKEGDLEKFKNDPTPLMKYALGYEFDSSKTKLAQDVFENYFTNRSRFNPNTLEEMISDGLFFKCQMDTVKLHTRYSSAPVYPYLYAHRGLLTFPMLFSSNITVEYGVAHGDEIFLQFAIPFVPPLLVSGDIKTSEHLLDFWTSFAQTSVPKKSDSSITWVPAERKQMRYMLIKEDLALINDKYPFANRVSKWNPLFSQ